MAKNGQGFGRNPDSALNSVKAAEGATNITVTRIFQELGRVGLCDPEGLFDASGRILPLHLMPEDIRRAISSVDIEERMDVEDRPVPGQIAIETGPSGAVIEDDVASVY